MNDFQHLYRFVHKISIVYPDRRVRRLAFQTWLRKDLDGLSDLAKALTPSCYSRRLNAQIMAVYNVQP